jgi:hypothetical protein
VALRQTTLNNSLNRRRFVTPEAAEPYLCHRERANAQRGYRKARKAIAELASRAPYGTDTAAFTADQLAAWTDYLVRCAQALVAAPTPGETKAANTYRLAAD